MTLKLAKQIVKAKYPFATCHFDAAMGFFTIRATRSIASLPLGKMITSKHAWKAAASKLL